MGETSIPMSSLPSGLQKEIEQIHENCPAEEWAQNRGLITFTVSGAKAFLFDSLNFCGDGSGCNHGAGCATGYTHTVEIYIRAGNKWTKTFSKDVTEPIFLSIEEEGKFKALVVKVHAGWEKECPSISSSPTEWKYRSCDMIVRWDNGSKKFTYKPL
jgi:hypothetical protein